MKLRHIYKLPVLVLFIAAVCFLLLTISIVELRWMQSEHLKYHHDDTTIISKTDKSSEIAEASNPFIPKYVVYDREGNRDFRHLRHVFEMFEYFNCARTSLNFSDWDILWTFHYPFRILSDTVKNLKPHQLVNHFPGTGFITNKIDLATSGILHIPPAFKLPQQKDALLKYVIEWKHDLATLSTFGIGWILGAGFSVYDYGENSVPAKVMERCQCGRHPNSKKQREVEKHPTKLFVQKSNSHRGIRIQAVEKLDLNSPNTFIQEYIHNPLLVDGHKFDVGIYAILTSIDPLRLYTYNGDFLLRFCPEKYHPFDANNLNKYVIGDDYLPTWEVPSLKKYYNELGFTMKESISVYLRTQGKNPDIIWNQIEEAVRIVVLKKEPQIIKALTNYNSKHNFFEMFRFDFVVDDDLNVFLLEANMSPNLSSDHFPPNQLLYRQVLFNLFSLIGLNHLKRRYQTPDAEVALKNIVVDSKLCASPMCQICTSPDCQLCVNCLTQDNTKMLKQTYREFNSKQDLKRIFPPSMTQEEAASPFNLDNFSPENQLIYRWFIKKCLMDKHWC